MIPRPLSDDKGQGWFELGERTGVVADPAAAGVARWLRTVLVQPTGLALEGHEQAIQLRLDPNLAAEHYRLTVTKGRALIEGGDPAGVFYGAQTLRQLLPPEIFRSAPARSGPWRVPCGTIIDGPRFRWRGCLIDVARHFLPVRELLRYVDLLALHKFNVLHLHLTDDQGWRIEIKRFPRLTEVGGWRQRSMAGWDGAHDNRPHGGYYSREDIKEIVAYAAERHMTVVPEIDIPGHTQAAIAAYPELGSGAPPGVATCWGIHDHILNADEDTIKFFEAVFDEVLALFPSRYVCIGGDECVTSRWKDNPRIAKRMAELDLRDFDELRAWFVRHFGDYFSARGRLLVGWDEIVHETLPADAIVASWRGTQGGIDAAKAGHDVVMCSNDALYLDYRQSDDPNEPVPTRRAITLRDVHEFNPVPPSLDSDAAAHIIGVQASIWTEFIDNPRALDYLAFPRLCAAAEVAWGSAERHFADFSRRLATHQQRLAALGVEYRHASGPLPWQTRPGVPGRNAPIPRS